MTLDREVKEEYAERFDRGARALFRKRDVSPSYANSFPPRFTPLCIAELSEWDLPLEQATSYDPRFHVGGVAKLIEAGISPERANRYDKRFKYRDLLLFAREGIDGAVAAAYDLSFTPYQISCFVQNKVSPRRSKDFAGIFSKEELSKLDEKKVFLVDALGYSDRFSVVEAIQLIDVGCSSELAHQYAGFFDGMTIAELIRNNIPPAIANQHPPERDEYAKGFRYFLIKACRKEILSKGGVSDNEDTLSDLLRSIRERKESGKKSVDRKGYAARFSDDDIRELSKARIPPSTAQKYPERFSGSDIACLRKPYLAYDTDERIEIEAYIEVEPTLAQDVMQPPIPPSQARSYPDLFDGADIVWLVRADVSPDLAKEYADLKLNIPYVDRLNGCQIAMLHWQEIEPSRVSKELKKYNSRFCPSDALSLLTERVRPELANRYDRRFRAQDVIHIKYMTHFDYPDIPPEMGNAYDRAFSVKDIVAFGQPINRERVSPEDANAALNSLRDLNIAGLMQIGIDPLIGIGNTELSQLYLFARIGLLEDLSRMRTLSLIGAGKKGVVMSESGTSKTFKCSQDMEEEIRIYELIRDMNIEFKHVINLPKNPAEQRIERGLVQIVRLEYVAGESLFDLLQRDEDSRKLNAIDSMHIARDVCEGLIELRRAGIYHRDIHDKNVLVNQGKRGAVIIDLGAATTNPAEVNELNRAYGGNNDLISLGQIMYKMITGRNLFNEGKRFTFYSDVKAGIKTAREQAYDDPEKRAAMLDKVRKNAKPRHIADIIVDLLDDDLWIQPSLEEVLRAKKQLDDYWQQHVLHGYDCRFSVEDVRQFISDSIPPEQANAYGGAHDAYFIRYFIEAGISPEEADILTPEDIDERWKKNMDEKYSAASRRREEHPERWSGEIEPFLDIDDDDVPF